ncbi:MAG TPA: hypothetical protein VHY91_18325 [Pirellulales bacterium]|jgi:hypothetical protein|nr:hypothetical protein [Pirellulales bacterium]
MNRVMTLAICSFALVALVDGTAGDEPTVTAEQQQKPSFWMKKKLEYSEKILAGLASEDFNQIRQSAKSMNALGHIESWVHGTRPGYRTQLSMFHDANEQLITKANADDLDGATLAYVQLTLSCVNCHKLVRDVKSAKPSP